MQVHVWDRAVRLSHVSYPCLLVGLWITAENRWMTVHVGLGIALCAVLTFRVLWGFFGSNTARFSSFLVGPVRSAKYAAKTLTQARLPAHFGHSPLGGWSVTALLSAMSFQVATGLLSVDTDGLFSGALARFVSFKTGRQMSDLHELGFNLVLALICLHLAAIAFYALVKRDALIKPMITGKRSSADVPPGAEFQPASLTGLLICLAVASGVSGYLAWLQYG